MSLKPHRIWVVPGLPSFKNRLGRGGGLMLKSQKKTDVSETKGRKGVKVHIF